MKKLLLICGLLWSAMASAQFVPGQVLTAAELNSQFALYAPLTGATFTGPLVSPSITSTSTTQGRLDNSTSLATDAFVNQQGASAVATVPFAGVTGGTYNQATQGSGAQIVIFASGGVVTSSLTISNPGTGYAVGDLLALPSGNSDAVLRVTGVSSGGVTSVGIAYGGSGYTTGNQVTAQAVPPGRRAVVFTGTLTSNLTFIIQNGTFLTASREVEFINNTTGAFTITVKLSNGAGGSTGTGVALPQGTSNSTALAVYTDGVNDVWLANAGAAVVGGPGAFTTLSASSTVSGAGFTSLLSPYLTSASAASTYAPLVSPNLTGVPTAPTASATTATTQLATTAMVNSAVTSNSLGGSFTTLAASSTISGVGFSNYLASPPAIGGTTAASGKFTTVIATSTISPSTTAGIVGTTLADSAQAGSDGEYITATASGVALTSNTGANVASISLTAGDWDVSGVVAIAPAASTTLSNSFGGSSTTSITLGPLGTYWQFAPGSTWTAGALAQTIPTVRYNLSSTTTVFLVANAGFLVSTCTASGVIRARRVR
jgi:hypothetical protein